MSWCPCIYLDRRRQARAIPSLASFPTDDLYKRIDDLVTAAAVTSENKRKRVDGVANDDPAQLDGVKRRAVDDEYAEQPLSKPNQHAHILFFFPG